MHLRHSHRSWIAAAVMGFAAITVAGPAEAVISFDQNVTPDVIFGSGNANGAWTVDLANNIEVGLRAKVRFDNSLVGFPQNIFNSDGAGNYVHQAGQHPNHPGRAKWSFEWHVNVDQSGLSGAVLSGFTYLLSIDTDPSAAISFAAFDPIIVPATAAPDHAIGNNSTPNGGGATSGGVPATYAALISSNNVAQNSWQTNFFTPFFPPGYVHGTAGEYEFMLSVLDSGGSTVLASTQITVFVPEPGTMLVFAVGLLGLAVLGRRRLARRGEAALA